MGLFDFLKNKKKINKIDKNQIIHPYLAKDEQKDLLCKEAYEKTLLTQQFVDTTNFGDIGKTLYNIVKNMDANSVLKSLSELELEPGSRLIFEEVKESKKSILRWTEPVIELYNGKHSCDLFSHLTVKHSPMGAWQTYLLTTIYHILPQDMTVNYRHKYYVFSKDDILGEEMKNSTHSINLAPKIIQNNDLFFVSCCCIEGNSLKREYVQITFEQNKVVDFYFFNADYIYSRENESGIIF